MVEWYWILVALLVGLALGGGFMFKVFKDSLPDWRGW